MGKLKWIFRFLKLFSYFRLILSLLQHQKFDDVHSHHDINYKSILQITGIFTSTHVEVQKTKNPCRYESKMSLNPVL